MKNSQRYHKTLQFYDDSTQSKLSEEVSPFSGLLELRKKLFRKYDNCSSRIELKYVNDAIKGSTKRNVIKQRDYKDFDQQKEYLVERYIGSSALIKFQETIGYYVFYEDIPRLFVTQLAALVAKRVEQQRVIRYRALKHTLGVMEQTEEKNHQVINDMSKYLPSKILDQETQNSMQSIVKQLSILITKHNDMMHRYAVTEGCMTLLRTNKKKMNKLLTLQQTKSKDNKPLRKNQNKNQSNTKLKQRMSRQISSKQKKQSSRCMSSKSKRKQSNKKSVQQLLRLHSRQKTRSPQIFREQRIKKKHIRLYSSQQEQLTSYKQNIKYKRASHQKAPIETNPVSKSKLFKKKKVKYQN